MKMNEIIYATRHAALVTRLGRSPSEGLQTLHAAIERGDTAARAMSRTAGEFPPLCAAMFAAAENSPRPAALLDALSHLLERADRLRTQLFDALLYPLLLLNIILIQLIFFSEYVLPFAAAPLAARSGLIDTMISTHALTLIGALGLVLLNVAAFGGDVIEPLASRLPFAAPLRIAADEALWLRALGCLLEAGLPLADALREASSVVRVARVRAGVRGLGGQIERGQPLSRALYRQSKLDPLLAWAAEAGEEREDMAAALLEAADTLDTQVDRRCARAVKLAQPWALAMAGTAVLMVLAAFWVPFYSLTGAFQ